ncbi:MAG: CvpA family protein [Planctomycetes bacterium]|nr:CvpA family protein [Planctomycetota bacterium]
MGMDLIVLLLLVLFAVLGYCRGLLRHLASVGALVIASLAAGIVGRWAVGLFTRAPAMPSPLTYVIACVVAWAVLFIACRLILGRIAKKLGSDEKGEPKPWNRKLGALAGAAEVLLLAWVVIGILDALPEDFRKERLPVVHRELNGSLFTNYVVRPTSPATLLELQVLIPDLAVLSEHPEELSPVVAENKDFAEIARHPRVKAILGNPGLMKEWMAGNYGRFFANDEVRKALEDGELREKMRKVPVRAILHEAAEKARQKHP